MYTALDKMRSINLERYGIDGPVTPAPILAVRTISEDMERSMVRSVSDLEWHTINFIRERCEDLRFDPQKTSLTDSDGKSLKPGQIPFNMEMDLDRLCLETSIHRFLESGVAEDAFNIYYIYLEMFVGKYNKCKHLIESLSEFESNASSLLMSHRDHYSHSVYVFLIGLAIYDSCAAFRTTYNSMYHLDGKEAAAHFLKFWGLTALFHDIGYPFELPFEEVKSYFNGDIKTNPYVGYLNTKSYTKIPAEYSAKALRLSGNEPADNMAEILARRIDQLLGSHYSDRKRAELPGLNGSENFTEYLMAVLDCKPADPKVFGGFMDHAYFSAMLLMDYLFENFSDDQLNTDYTDALTAILLHNSIFKHSVQTQKLEGFSPEKYAIKAEWHPLAYLLMLCDELQCWDRTSYGQNSRMEVHAMGCDLNFSESGIQAKYIFDKALEKKTQLRDEKGLPLVGGTYKKMITDRNGEPKFLRDIEEIVAVNRDGCLSLTVDHAFERNIRHKKEYLSKTSYMHLYDFAVVLSGRRKHKIDEAYNDRELRVQMEAEFENKSLEYKIIDIERVKKFASYLDAIDCFYTDRPVAYPLMDHFTDDDMSVIGPMEHERWLWVHHIMGWTYDDKYESFLEYKTDENGKKTATTESELKCSIIREQTRTHKLMLKSGEYNKENAFKHYKNLEQSEKDKDTEPMNKLLDLLMLLDGVKFYSIPKNI